MSNVVQHASGPSDGLPDNVLSQAQVSDLLAQLEKLIQSLPSSLPLPLGRPSCYAQLILFHPLPLEWLEDIGEVGTVNRQLEVVFGTRTFGFKLKERGSVIECVVPILRSYLSKHPGDVILQKWLKDLFNAASDAHNEGNRSVPSNSNVKDLTQDESDNDTLPSAAAVLARACQAKRRRSESPVPEDTQIPDESLGLNTGDKKRRKTHVKRKGPLPPQDDIKTIPPETDPRMSDLPEVNADPSKGGAPPNLLVRKLTIRCFRLGTSVDKVLYRCAASSHCRYYLAARHADRVYKHASRCDDLKRMSPHLHASAVAALASSTDNSASLTSTKAVAPSNPSPEPAPTTPLSNPDIFAPFRDKGALDFAAQANLAATRFICATGVPPRVLDLPEWRNYTALLLSKTSGSSYRPPSATTMADKLIPARAAQATLDMQRILSTQYNLTISFDGLTKGNQTFYSLHVITSDRHIFLYTADVFRGSHNAEYVQTLVEEAVGKIGASRVAGVVSDDTNTTKKARRDLTTTYPSILNLADPIHKLNLVAKDICMDTEWKDMFDIAREIQQYFAHSSHASTRLSESRQDLCISSGLISMSGTRFGQAYLSTNSIRINMPAIHLAHRKGLFASVPARLEQVFDESSITATEFKMALIRFTLILEPIYQALTCLESSNSTLADVYAYWLAMLAALDRHFSSSECKLSACAISRFRVAINTRYVQALVKAPTDVYILGFFLHPDFRNADIFQRTNVMSSRLYIRIPATSPISPVPHIPDSVYVRIRMAGGQVLRHLLKAAELDVNHPLHGYDAQDAKTEFETQLRLYALGHHPFHRPLGKEEIPLAYWRSLKSPSEAFVISTVAEKLFSVLPNSMSDERTGSRITFLNSDLRSRTDIKTMIEQVRLMRWYSMLEGRSKSKPRTASRFRELSLQVKLSTKTQAREQLTSKAKDDFANDPANWLDDQPDELDPELRVEYGMEELSGKLSALRIINLQSPLLRDMLSASPTIPSDTNPASQQTAGSEPQVKEKGRIRTADKVEWDT